MPVLQAVMLGCCCVGSCHLSLHGGSRRVDHFSCPCALGWRLLLLLLEVVDCLVAIAKLMCVLPCFCTAELQLPDQQQQQRRHVRVQDGLSL
jgi:hypothetical protein